MPRETGRAGYKAKLVKELERRFPGCFLISNNPNDIQGIPDLLMLFGNHWAMLEVKASETSPYRPNQEYYIEMFGRMSFAAFVYPENEGEILDALQHALRPC